MLKKILGLLLCAGVYGVTAGKESSDQLSLTGWLKTSEKAFQTFTWAREALANSYKVESGRVVLGELHLQDTDSQESLEALLYRAREGYSKITSGIKSESLLQVLKEFKSGKTLTIETVTGRLFNAFKQYYTDIEVSCGKRSSEGSRKQRTEDLHQRARLQAEETAREIYEKIIPWGTRGVRVNFGGQEIAFDDSKKLIGVSEGIIYMCNAYLEEIQKGKRPSEIYAFLDAQEAGRSGLGENADATLYPSPQENALNDPMSWTLQAEEAPRFFHNTSSEKLFSVAEALERIAQIYLEEVEKGNSVTDVYTSLHSACVGEDSDNRVPPNSVSEGFARLTRIYLGGIKAGKRFPDIHARKVLPVLVIPARRQEAPAKSCDSTSGQRVEARASLARWLKHCNAEFETVAWAKKILSKVSLDDGGKRLGIGTLAFQDSVAVASKQLARGANRRAALCESILIGINNAPALHALENARKEDLTMIKLREILLPGMQRWVHAASFVGGDKNAKAYDMASELSVTLACRIVSTPAGAVMRVCGQKISLSDSRELIATIAAEKFLYITYARELNRKKTLIEAYRSLEALCAQDTLSTTWKEFYDSKQSTSGIRVISCSKGWRLYSKP